MCHGQAMIGWQGWGPEARVSEPSPGLFSLHPVVIPEPQSKWPAGMETTGRCVASSQYGPFFTFPTLSSSSLLLLLLVKVNVLKVDVDKGGQQDTVLNSFLAIFLPSLTTVSYFSPPASTCLDTAMGL